MIVNQRNSSREVVLKMKDSNDTVPPRNRKRLWYVLLLLFVLCVLSGIGFYVRIPNPPKPLSASEQELVGMWRYQGGDPAVDLGYGYELHSDRTCTKYFFDRETGELRDSNTDLVWWRDGDRLTVRLLYGAGYTVLGVWDRSCPCDDVMHLTADGPGRFTFQGFREIEFWPSPRPSGNGTMIRGEGPMEKPSR
jgi:hypothetical protein